MRSANVGPSTSSRGAATTRLGLGTALLVAVAPLAPVHPSQTPVFRDGIDVVRLDVAVVRNGVPVRGLTAGDFVVTDNGTRNCAFPGSGPGLFNSVTPVDLSRVRRVSLQKPHPAPVAA